MLTIELTGLKFYAYHGLYEEEKILGGEFEVNVSVLYMPKAIPVENIAETIDYTLLYQLIKNCMQQPTPLLETLASTIAQEILSAFSMAEKIILSVKKINPPIIAFEGAVCVKYELIKNR